MKHLLPSRWLGAAAALAFSTQFGHAQLVINEFMQSNIDRVFDELYEFPDSWVELYNPGTSAVELSDYALGIKEKASKAYALPKGRVAPGAHMVVYCDKVGNGIHTDFRLESGKGGGIWLFKNGELADAVTDIKKQPAPNVAYGRKTSGSDKWGYMAAATPGADNCGEIVKDLLPNPLFSVSGCVTDSPIKLSISLPEDAPEGSVLRFTLDGSEPTEESETTRDIEIKKTTVVRAKLFCPGYITSRSLAQSYIFHPRKGLPVVSMTGNQNYFTDKKIGILVEGSNPSDPNYRHDWRRPVNIEYFEPTDFNTAVVNQLIETRVKGGATRSNPLKSMVLYANKRFGEKRLKHEFFTEDLPELDDWKSVELRNSGNDFDYMYFRDAAIQRVMGRHCDLDWQPWQPTVFYLNGKYMGILNLRSRTNEDYVYTVYDGMEDVNVVENWWEVKEGDDDCASQFSQFIKDHREYDDFDAVMDISEFANIMIMNLFQANLDFPGNNIVMWRPQGEGGKWRWIAKDTDFGLGLYGRSSQYKTLNWIYDNNYDRENAWANQPDHTRLFRRLMDTDKFRDMFIDRAGTYMGDFMNRRGHNDAINEMYDLIKEEYGYHRALFNPWWPDHKTEVNNAKEWVAARTPFFYTHIGDFCKLGKPGMLTIDKDRQDDLKLVVNGIPMNYRDFDGKWWAGRKITVSAETPEGTEVKGWNILVTKEGVTNETHVEGPELSYEFPDCTRVAINSVTGDAGIGFVMDDDSVGFNPDLGFELFDISGRKVGQFSSLGEAAGTIVKGVYVAVQKHYSFKITF